MTASSTALVTAVAAFIGAALAAYSKYFFDVRLARSDNRRKKAESLARHVRALALLYSMVVEAPENRNIKYGRLSYLEHWEDAWGELAGIEMYGSPQMREPIPNLKELLASSRVVAPAGSDSVADVVGELNTSADAVVGAWRRKEKAWRRR